MANKKNGNVEFYEDEHKYLDVNTNTQFISVTTLIHEYSQEFDEDFWSSYKAMEALLDPEIFNLIKGQLISTKKFHKAFIKKFELNPEAFEAKKQEILAEYAKKRDDACKRGTEIHSILENSFYGKEKFDFSKYGIKNLSGNFTCKKDYYELILDRGIYPEYLIYKSSSDGILNLAGQIDLLVKDGNEIYIIDWKTNGKIDQKSFYNKYKKSYEMMKFPLNNLMDCNYSHYCLQLSTYAYMLQQINPNFEIKMLKLVHFDHEGNQNEYDIPYLKDDVEKMLKHYKKKIKIQKELDKDKPYII